ncbi:MAG: hypothetical protein LC704_06640, partial [Actinobacteria bacterium]|nr:hypothetical protein [Actinomycetota bacterium]
LSMVETISPVVYGNQMRYRTALALHAGAAALSAALLGAALGSLGAVLGGPWGSGASVFVALLACAYSLREWLGLPIPIFDRRRQVPRWWRDFFSPNVAAALYGFSLGLGFLTFLSYGTFTVVAASSMILADPAVGAIACLPFGLVRGLSVALPAVAGRPSPPSAAVDRLAELAASRAPRILNAAALTGLIVAALVAA